MRRKTVLKKLDEAIIMPPTITSGTGYASSTANSMNNVIEA